MRFLPLNHTNFIAELKDLDETLALLSALQAAELPGLTDMIPAARTLMIGFSPAITSAEELAGEILQLNLAQPVSRDDKCVEVPVNYNGEDLADVAQITGLSVQEVIRRHTSRDYRVAFCGFAPGFGYLVGGDPALRVPRRKTPRTRIPAGAVGLAGEFSGVYPQASPGGWQLIGTTPLKMWDLTRTPPAYVQPGYRVRFVDLASAKRIVCTPPAIEPETSQPESETDKNAVRFSILAAPLPALFQDLGRFGQTGQGVSASGALDRGAFKAANRIAGNAETEPCLELTGGGFSFRSHGAAVIGITGAPCGIRIRTGAGKTLMPAPYTPIALEDGDVVTLSAPQAGVRSYLSVRSGFKVQKVLGSASTDTLANIGPDPVRAGSVLTIKKPAAGLSAVSLTEAPAFEFPKSGETVTLDLILGPRPDWVLPQALALLSGEAWEVTAQSNRVGIRLTAPASLARAGSGELPSEGVVTGAVQVPPDGKPLLFLADHPLTGGYPVIGAVAGYHLDLAGQIPVGAKIRFRPVAPFSEITPARPAHAKPQGPTP